MVVFVFVVVVVFLMHSDDFMYIRLGWKDDVDQVISEEDLTRAFECIGTSTTTLTTHNHHHHPNNNNNHHN